MTENDILATAQVLINDEGQYSLWPQGKAIPNGWQPVGVEGAKEDCLQFVEKNWTDMRPKSLQALYAGRDTTTK